MTAVPGKASVLVVALLLVLAVAALYVQAGRFEAVDFDDNEYVFASPLVLSGITARGTAWAATAFCAANWHPLTWISHMLDAQLFGADPGLTTWSTRLFKRPAPGCSFSSSGPRHRPSGRARSWRLSSRCIR
jgi:hypothetical protein